MEHVAAAGTVPAAAPPRNLHTLLSHMENEVDTTTAPEVAPAPVTPPAPSEDSRIRLDAARQFAEEQYDRLRRATATQVENMRGYTEEARRHINEGWDVTRAKVNEGWDVTRAKVNEGWDVTRTKVNEGWDVTCAKAKDLHQAGEEYVRANPSGSVLGALGLGVILGLLIGGRRH